MLKIHENQLPATALAEGGEGVLYEWEKDKIIKVFKKTTNIKEKKKKIERLLTKNLPKNVVQPLEVVCNQQNQFIGYTMKKIEGDELRKLSNKKFVSLNQLHIQDVLTLLCKIKETLKALHQQGIAVGDLNESNILFNEKNDIFFIDVDSWAVDEFPCNVCMETFKDPLLNGNQFNENTDFYAFSVLVFKTLTRLHPFGGTTTPDIPILERMEKGISVMTPDVKMPRNVNHWSFFPPNLLEGLKSIFHEKKRILLDKELENFSNALTFCSHHGDFYYQKYNQCPVCHANAKVVLQPTKIKSTSGIPLVLVTKPPELVAFINLHTYLNQHNQIVDLRTKKTVDYRRNQEVYFSNDGTIIYYISTSKIEVHVLSTNQVSVFEKVHQSQVYVKDCTMYYQDKNLNMYRVTLSEKGNVSKVIAKTAFRLNYAIQDETHYILANRYDNMVIFNVNGYHYQFTKTMDIEKMAFHFDEVAHRWLVVLQTKSNTFYTLIFENNRLLFEADNLNYHTPINNLCFNNNTIFTPQEGSIRGLQIEKFHYKDFPCEVVHEDSKLYRKEKAFFILNEKECYRFG